jgi:hypothetical protein
MKRKIISKRIYKAGYEVRTEDVSLGEGDTRCVMKSAYTSNGDYIGDPKTAFRLCKSKGIKPEKRTDTSDVCSIGFCEKEKKWYGWSHRAIFGFGIGSKTKRGDCGYVPSDVTELAKEYKEWNNKDDLIIRDFQTLRIYTPSCEVVGKRDDGSLVLKRSNTLDYYDVKTGKGEWTAQSLDDAKQMAMDFAEGVS